MLRPEHLHRIDHHLTWLFCFLGTVSIISFRYRHSAFAEQLLDNDYVANAMCLRIMTLYLMGQSSS
jgi:hypothetical protein